MGLPKGVTNNPNGRPVGSKNKTTEAWQALADSITERQTAQFNELMEALWNGDREDQILAAHLYLKLLSRIMPKMPPIPEETESREIVISIVDPRSPER